jgi:cytochrome P450
MITRGCDVHSVLRDRVHFSSDDSKARRPLVRKTGNRGTSVLSSDPPDQTRLRRAVANHFKSTELSSWKSLISVTVSEIFERFSPGQQIDVIRDVAVPLPLMVMAEALGVVQNDQMLVAQWLEDDITSITSETAPSEVDRLQRSSECLHSYLSTKIDRACCAIKQDSNLLGDLVSGPFTRGELSKDEVASFVTLLLRASSATVTNLIGNGMLALLKNPTQLNLLLETPDLWDDAIEELLRYDAPVQSVFRIVKNPVKIHGVMLQVGDRIHLVLASANRDEDLFGSPDELQITRICKNQLGFGAGIHRCLGASIARLQAKMALQALLERVPAPFIVGGEENLQYAWSWTLRGLATLPIRQGNGRG